MKRSKPIVWVTRPEPGNAKTCASLKEMGCDARAVPLTKTVALADTVSLPALTSDTVIAVTSANALRHLDEAALATLRANPLYAVGEATAETAQTFGFETVVPSQGNAVDLARLVADQIDPDTAIVYLTGKTRTGSFEETLSALARNRLTIIETYETKKVSQLTCIEQEIVAGRVPDAILYHALTSSTEFFAQILDTDWLKIYEKTVFYCLSQRIADALPSQWQARTIIAERPDEAHMMAAIEGDLLQ